MHTLGNSYHLMFSRGADGRVKRDKQLSAQFESTCLNATNEKKQKVPVYFYLTKNEGHQIPEVSQTQWDVLCRGECDERAVCDAGSDLLLVSGVPAEVSSQHFFPLGLTEEVKCVCWWYYAHCHFTKFSFWILFCLLLNEGVWNASLHASSGT